MTGKEAVQAGNKGKKAESSRKAEPYDPWTVIKYPHLAEKSRNMVEFENKLTFVVKRDAHKPEIKRAIEALLDVKVVKIKTEITSKGEKKAYAKLSGSHQASEIATRLGMV